MNIVSKKSISTFASLAALAVGTAGTAQAGVLASSILEVTDFLIEVQTPGGTFRPVTINDISISTGFNTTDVVVQLDSANNGEPIAATEQQTFDQGVGLNRCIGTNCPAPNFSPPLAPPVAGDYANANTLLEGAAVIIPGTGEPGADASVRTDVGLDPLANGNNSGSSQANLGLISTISFIALNDIELRFSGLYSYNLRALVTDDLAPTGNSAQAATAWDLEVSGTGDDPLNFSYTPAALLGLNVGTTVPGDNRDESGTGSLNSQDELGLLPLVQGRQYNLTIRHQNSADATSNPISVPEPTSIALLGGGLLSLAAWRRRTKKI